MRNCRRSSTAGYTSLLLSFIVAVCIFSGAVAAAPIYVDTSGAESPTPGVPVTLPVYISNAVDVVGLKFSLAEDSGATVNFKSSDVGATLTGKKNVVLIPSSSDPVSLNGKVKILEIEVTPVSSDPLKFTIGLQEVINSANADVTETYLKDLTSASAGTPDTTTTTTTSVDTKKEDVQWVYDPLQGLNPADPQPVQTISSTTGTSTGNLPSSQPTTKATATKTKKSPGFLPFTLVAALAAAGILLARKGGR